MAFSLSNFYQSCWTSSKGKLEAIQGLSLQQKNRHLQIYWIVTAFQSLKVSIQKKRVFSCYQTTTLVSLKPTTYTLNTSVKDSEEVHTGLKLVMFLLELWAMSHPLRGSRWWPVMKKCVVLLLRLVSWTYCRLQLLDLSNCSDPEFWKSTFFLQSVPGGICQHKQVFLTN